MEQPITRRDFLDGVALAGAAWASNLCSPVAFSAPKRGDGSSYYPPILTGLRGSHPGSFEAAHSLRDGAFWIDAATPAKLEEHYDLIVVGGGISGLSAAHFYRAARKDARILILDNHDDFGGHAKRNEFHLGRQVGLMNGGTQDIDSPRPYSAIAAGLLKTLGIDPIALDEKCTDKKFYASLGLGRGIFFDAETFGADRLVTGAGTRPWRELLSTAPLTDAVKRDIARIEEADIDYLPGLGSEEKKARLSRMSYADFLLNIVKADPGVLPYFQAMTHDEWGVGIDAVSALDVWAFDFPGFQGLGLKPGSAPHMGTTAAGYADGGSASFHFPDGNASIVRLLVGDLIPAAVAGHNAEDIVVAKFDYSALDQPHAPVRIRLNSIVVGVRNISDPGGSEAVEITYTSGGKVYKVRAQDCVMACYNTMIPYLCPELPDAQKEALHYLVKVPLVYSSVAVRNWRAFEKLGIESVYAPGSYHSSLRLNPAVNIGGYKSVRSPNDPILVHMIRAPVAPGLDERSQHRVGRADLLTTSFETFEHKIRDQMGRILEPGGFDPARDITAITVNRWPHGYAYEYNPLFDPEWPPGEEPHVLGRARFGRIAIANSDSGAAAYTDSAIDEGYRAIQELLAI